MTNWIVIKAGGTVIADEEAPWAAELAAIRRAGAPVVLVHGGGPLVSRDLRRAGVASEFVQGQRVTDAGTLEVVMGTLCGRVNKALVHRLQQEGLAAVGISGVDGGLVQARPRQAPVDLGRVGAVDRIRPDLVYALVRSGHLPVVAPVSTGPQGPLNVNADAVALGLAVELRARRLVMLTDAPGVLRDTGDPDSVIRRLGAGAAQDLLGEGVVQGGMIPKVEAGLAAAAAGITSLIVDGRQPGVVEAAALAAEPPGTVIPGAEDEEARRG